MRIRKGPSAQLIVLLVFGIMGLCFFGVGAGIGIEHLLFKKSAVETTAMIISSNDYEGQKPHNTYLEYEAEGYLIQSGINETSSDYYPGKLIKVFYSAENPYVVRSNMRMIFVWIFGGIGVAFLAVTLILLLHRGSQKRQKKRLLEHGERVYATISGVERNYLVQINGRPPYYIECWWQDSMGNVHVFKSENLMENPAPLLQAWNLTELPVYLDYDNPKKYYVDVSELTQQR